VNITTIPPMPATNCPSWCQSDHPDDWAHTVSNLSRPHEVPMADEVLERLRTATYTVEPG